MKLLILLLLTGCGSMDVNVSDSEHRIIVENICDAKTFPNQVERKQCVLDLLEILNG